VSEVFEPIQTAIQEGDVNAARMALAESPDVATLCDDAGQSALHHAAYAGQTKIVDLLIEYSADVGARAVGGYTPLHYTAFAGHAEAFDRLIDAGADIFSLDDSLTTVLHAAASGGNRTIVDKALDAGIAPGILNLYGEAPNHRAAQRNRLDIMQHLIAQGAEPQPIDRYDLGLLHKAAIGDSIETLQWLVEHGHDMEAINLPGETALHGAAEMGRENAVRVLIERGADVNCRTHDDATPLHAAAFGGHASLIECLLEAGANPRAVDVQGRTALHSAAIRGQSEILPLLLDAGLSPDGVDSDGHTAIDLATAYGRAETRNLLIERGGTASELDPAAVDEIPSRPMAAGEMMLWYLGHSGWAIRTANRWLIIDYAPGEPDREDAGLLNGRVKPGELGDLPATVFISHHHADHFDRRVLSWAEDIDAEYVFGWDAPDSLPGIRFAQQDEQRAGDVAIRAIPATDAGSAFLIQADGFSIYHAGDHATNHIPPEPAFADGVDWLARQLAPVDVAFLPVFGCGLPETEALRAGNRYTIDRLKPRVVFPMHVGWTSYFYRRFADWAASTGITTPLGIADQPGDRFRVTVEGVEREWA